jgi:RecA/RadA recombinase
MVSFLKDRVLVEEGHQVDDLLDYSHEVNRLDSYLKGIERSSIVGYIGKFGSGKSTTIYQLKKKYSNDKNTKWFDFDAWKYPERRDLWEGFVLDIADQLGDRKKVQKKIEGKDTKSAVVDVATDVVGAGMELFGEIADRATGIFGKIAEKAQIADKLVGFFKRSPVKRVFEIQDLLVTMLSALPEESIYIVVEDIDRSGDAGQYFLETLRQFIRNNLSTKKIVVLVPIGSEVYNETDKYYSSYQKTLDYTLFFEPRGIRYKNFIESVFDEDSFPKSFQTAPNVTNAPKWREHLEDWFQLATSNKLTIREIKSVIRSADLAYSNLKEQGFEPDPRGVLAFQLLNNIRTEGGTRWISRIGTENPINDNCPVSKYLQVIGANSTLDTFSKQFVSMKLRLVDRMDEPIPRLLQNTFHEDDKGYVLSDYYLIPSGQKTLLK